MTSTRWLATAGFVATAVSFGPARMGFGLFLPAFRDTFTLSTAQAGVIATLGFLAFLLALPLTVWFGVRYGPRIPVLLGAVCAVGGFAIVASASHSLALAAGIALAGASAGFCWSPFNDAVERVVPPQSRPTALSAVSTGTTFGVAGAGALFLLVSGEGMDWRVAWAIFALLGLTAGLLAWPSVPTGRATRREGALSNPKLFRWQVAPLYAAAISFGASNAVFVSFAADHVVASGGLAGLSGQGASAVIFVSYGVAGSLGLTTGRIEGLVGINALIAGIFAAFTASLVLIAEAPDAWTTVVVAAGLHGAGVMTFSAVLSFWSLRLFPGRGSLGFTIALVGVAIGSVAGPLIMGALADEATLRAAFLSTALAPLAVALFFAMRRVRA